MLLTKNPIQGKMSDDKWAKIESLEDRRELLVRILNVLQPIFLYDNGEFLDDVTTNELLPLVINLFGFTELNDYTVFCDEYLVS